MYLKMSGLEAQNSNYESLSDEQLREQLDALKKQVDEMSKVLQQRQSWENPQWGGDQVNDSELNVDDVHLYRWWGERLEKNWVLEVIKSLKEPYKTEVNWFVKGKDILGLQRYLNAKIDSWAIDKTKLEAALSAKRIWLRGGHLLEDWKFWPQTLETIRVLAELPEWWNGTPATGWDEWNGNEAPIPQDNQVEFSWELPNGIAKELVKYVNDNLANELAMGNNEKLEINGWSPNWANLSLSTWLSSVAYASVQYSINLKKCINNDWSIATDYIKNTLLPIAKDNLKQQKKAVLAVKWNLLRGKEYSMDDIFWDDEEVKNDLVLKTKLENYFKIFEDKKVTFDLWNYDDDTKFDNWNIKLTLDDNNGNEDYNKWRNNPDILIFPAKDIIDDDYTLNETKFKEKLKWITRAIAEKENIS